MIQTTDTLNSHCAAFGNMSTQQQQGGPSIPLQEGALYGAAAFVAGYAATFLLMLIDVPSDLVEDQFEFAGWLFFNAQFVQIEGDGSATVDVLAFLAASEEMSFPALLFTVVVALVIFAAGYLLARSFRSPEMTTDEGTVYGASVVVGYLPLAFLGALLFETSPGLFGEGTPDIFAAVLLAGIVFPAIIGALGGYYAVRSGGS